MFKNLYFWFKEIWNTRSYDQNYIYSLWKRSIEYLYKDKQKSDEIISCLNSLTRLKKEDYVNWEDKNLSSRELFERENKLIKKDIKNMVKIFNIIEKERM